MNKKLIISVTLAMIAITGCKEKSRPSVSMNQENTASGYKVGELPDIENLEECEYLPDPLRLLDGRRVERLDQWEERRAELLAMFQNYETGPKFQTPKSCVSASISEGEEVTIDIIVDVDGETLSFSCPAYIPQGKGPFPAVIGITYSASAGSLPNEVFTDRNIAIIGFPYEEVIQSQQRRGMQPINNLYPEHLEIGSLAGWTWGVSRLIDGLENLGEKSRIDLEHLAVTGGNLGGMIALYAGAFDERIALTIPQDAGCGAAASWRVLERLVDAEKLSDVDSHWFLRNFKQLWSEDIGRLPVDQHELCALIAPRALLLFGNTDYPWLGDEASYVSLYAARKVWEQFGKEDRIGWSIQGNHPICSLTDSQRSCLEAFVDKFLLGRDLETNVHDAEDFKYVNCERWCNW